MIIDIITKPIALQFRYVIKTEIRIKLLKSLRSDSLI